MSNLTAPSPRLLVTTGPESAGKTTLAGDLSRVLHAPLVNEQSRPFLEQRLRAGIRDYVQDDLLTIAKLQYSAEREALARAGNWVVCDTDLLVIVVWSEVIYGDVAPGLQALFEASLREPRHYLLCDPSIPWEADPLRVNPHDRHILLQRYQNKLESLQLSWEFVSGTPEARLRAVLANQTALAAN